LLSKNEFQRFYFECLRTGGIPVQGEGNEREKTSGKMWRKKGSKGGGTDRRACVVKKTKFPLEEGERGDERDKNTD